MQELHLPLSTTCSGLVTCGLPRILLRSCFFSVVFGHMITDHCGLPPLTFSSNFLLWFSSLYGRVVDGLGAVLVSVRRSSSRREVEDQLLHLEVSVPRFGHALEVTLTSTQMRQVARLGAALTSLRPVRERLNQRGEFQPKGPMSRKELRLLRSKLGGGIERLKKKELRFDGKVDLLSLDSG